jgi:hypothetical protein
LTDTLKIAAPLHHSEIAAFGSCIRKSGFRITAIFGNQIHGYHPEIRLTDTLKMAALHHSQITFRNDCFIIRQCKIKAMPHHYLFNELNLPQMLHYRLAFHSIALRSL